MFTQNARSILAAGFVGLSLLAASCAGTSVGVRYRVYDGYRSDYHNWDANEGVYYNQWTVETHRDPHQDFRKLKRDDQNEYWKWRHDHPDRH
jgi:hypothetical protein